MEGGIGGAAGGSMEGGIGGASGASKPGGAGGTGGVSPGGAGGAGGSIPGGVGGAGGSPGGGGGMVPSSFSSLIFIPPNGVGYSLDVVGSGITIIARQIARSIGPLRCRRVDEPQSNASYCECKR